MDWLSAHDSNTDGLLEIPEAGDWTDLFGRSYHVLYDEVLWYRANVCYGRILEYQQDFERAADYLRWSQFIAGKTEIDERERVVRALQDVPRRVRRAVNGEIGLAIAVEINVMLRRCRDTAGRDVDAPAARQTEDIDGLVVDDVKIPGSVRIGSVEDVEA